MDVVPTRKHCLDGLVMHLIRSRPLEHVEKNDLESQLHFCDSYFTCKNYKQLEDTKLYRQTMFSGQAVPLSLRRKPLKWLTSSGGGVAEWQRLIGVIHLKTREFWQYLDENCKFKIACKYFLRRRDLGFW